MLIVPLAVSRHDNDFRHIYLGARALAVGSSPYPASTLLGLAEKSGIPPKVGLNPYVYLPFTGQILGPLALMPLPKASQTWFWINQFLVALTVLWTVLLLPSGSRPVLMGAIMILLLALFHPLHRTLTAGQLTLVLTACTGAVALLLHRGFPVWAGAVAAFATLFKLTPGILLLPLWVWGGWRGLAGFGGTLACGMGWSIWKNGLGIQLEFLPMLMSMGHGRSSWQEHGASFWKDEYNQSFNSLLTHLLVGDNGIAQPWVAGPAWLANGLSMSLALMFLGWLIWTHRPMLFSRRSGAATLQVSVGVPISVYQSTVVALLIPALLWDHYLIATVPPAIWLLSISWQRRAWFTFRVAALCLLVMALPFRPDSPDFRSGLGVLLMSGKLWPAVVLAVLLLRLDPLGDNSRTV
jgi:hypothetical protein